MTGKRLSANALREMGIADDQIASGATEWPPEAVRFRRWDYDRAVWYFRTNVTHRPLGGNSTPRFWTLVWAPDNRRVLAGDDYGTVRLWDLATHRQIGSPLNGHSGANVGVSLVAFSPDGKTLATGGDGNDLAWLWDLATHQQIGSPLTGTHGAVNSVAFSPGGKLLSQVKKKSEGEEAPAA
jgi:WD40 repeat protein